MSHPVLSLNALASSGQALQPGFVQVLCARECLGLQLSSKPPAEPPSPCWPQQPLNRFRSLYKHFAYETWPHGTGRGPGPWGPPTHTPHLPHSLTMSMRSGCMGTMAKHSGWERMHACAGAGAVAELCLQELTLPQGRPHACMTTLKMMPGLVSDCCAVKQDRRGGNLKHKQGRSQGETSSAGLAHPQLDCLRGSGVSMRQALACQGC